jgi:hypothetical protein
MGKYIKRGQDGNSGVPEYNLDPFLVGLSLVNSYRLEHGVVTVSPMFVNIASAKFDSSYNLKQSEKEVKR